MDDPVKNHDELNSFTEKSLLSLISALGNSFYHKNPDRNESLNLMIKEIESYNTPKYDNDTREVMNQLLRKIKQNPPED